MKALRRPAKVDLLLNLFDQIGKSYSVEEIYEITEIPNYNALKALFSYIRKAPHIPEENRIDVRIRDGRCIRVN